MDVPLSVLIVEDNRISAKVLENTLRNCGYETLFAEDGQQAMDRLEEHPEIAMVITDIVMPHSDGVEFLRNLEQRSDWTELPVIVCTSKKPHEIVTASVSAGDWHYLVKPIKADALVEKIREALARQRPFLQNLAETMGRLGMDAHAFLDLLHDFLKIVETKIEQLQRRRPVEPSLETRDLLESAAVLGADRLIHVLDRLNGIAVFKNSAMNDLVYSRTLRELKGLRHYLTVYTAKVPAQLQSKSKSGHAGPECTANSNGCFVPWLPDDTGSD